MSQVSYRKRRMERTQQIEPVWTEILTVRCCGSELFDYGFEHMWPGNWSEKSWACTRGSPMLERRTPNTALKIEIFIHNSSSIHLICSKKCCYNSTDRIV